MTTQIFALVLVSVLLSLGFATLLAFALGTSSAKRRTFTRIAAVLGATIVGDVLTVAIAVG